MKLYYVGPEREYTSLTALFLALAEDEEEKTIYIDPGVYDIFAEYKAAGIPSPPDDVTSPDYFAYNAFLPLNTKLIGIGNVLLKFAPTPEQITYGESRTWSPLNILGACHIENIEIFCTNCRYCIHDDSHNKHKNTLHSYKHVRCTYRLSGTKDGRLLGFNNTIGNGMAQGCQFQFDSCSFVFEGGGNHSAFYTHESGKSDPDNSPSLIFRNCLFLGSPNNERTLRLQSLAIAPIRVHTRLEGCVLVGGIYLHIYKETSAQHYDLLLIRSGNPPVKIDRPEENPYPVKIYN